MSHSNDDVKQKILARRAKLVAAALVGAGAVAACDTGGKNDPLPGPCLTVSPMPRPDSGNPQPCLSVAPGPVDAGDAGDAGDASDSGTRDT